MLSTELEIRMSELIKVVAGVLIKDSNQVLIARRRDDAHQGGLWEFPGGKVESDESENIALKRELREELDVEIEDCRPLIRISHQYPEIDVILDVWLIRRWTGIPAGKEGQQIQWVTIDELGDYRFPEANYPIIKSIQLPSTYLIAPPPSKNLEVYYSAIESFVRSGIKLIQLRYNDELIEKRPHIIHNVMRICHENGGKLLLNSTPATALSAGVDGVHLNSNRLLQLNERPLDDNYLVSASCHNKMELDHAQRIQADFVVLSPVKKTRSHPDMTPLGWDKYERLVQGCNVPVFALGGMVPGDISIAWERGSQGITLLSGLWSAKDPEALIRQYIQ